jgi:hypothetical protein
VCSFTHYGPYLVHIKNIYKKILIRVKRWNRTDILNEELIRNSLVHVKKLKYIAIHQTGKVLCTIQGAAAPRPIL